MNKLDELDLVLNYSDSSHPIDIAVVTETWQPEDVSNEFLAVDNFNLFTKPRCVKRGFINVMKKK